MKKALITGVTGQDGSYLAEFLLENSDTKYTVLSVVLLYLIQNVLITFMKIHITKTQNFIFITVT